MSVFRGRLACGLMIYLLAYPCACLRTGMVIAAEPVDFVKEIQPIFAEKCVRCHNDEKQAGGLRLDRRADAQRGGDSGSLFEYQPGTPSLLLQRITANEDERMPPEGDPLPEARIEKLRRWVEAGAPWPEGVDKIGYAGRFDWWSFHALKRPELPEVTNLTHWSRTVIDDFILSKLQDHGLTPSREADRRTLFRRLNFDLLGLPPDPDAVESFVNDPDPQAYERLVDDLLASSRYGERWARHWLDVVHYGDTHGYDKDKPRPHAWPYRDYVIRALNSDKPYARLVQEQIAGDVLWPETEDGLTATGFISAGPWDFIGHAELPESKLDGQLARLMDRDDMVTNTFNTFCSVTVQCGRCHHHKFDPVTQTDYYRLQAVFAALDRADRQYDRDPETGRKRAELLAKQHDLQARKKELDQKVAEEGGAELVNVDLRLAAAQQAVKNKHPLEFGYHSQIEVDQSTVKWVQLDFGKPVKLAEIILIGCHDDYNNIGAGFGFPVRYRVELANDPEFQSSRLLIVDETRQDVKNPGITLQTTQLANLSARYLRITATKLAARSNDFIFALAEVKAFDAAGRNLAVNAQVTALDSIEAPPRWRKSNLVDGLFPGVGQKEVDQLQVEREQVLNQRLTPATRQTQQRLDAEWDRVHQVLSQLPALHKVYAGLVHTGSGSFVGTGANGGKPRPIHVLKRGDLRSPGEEVGPGYLPLAADQPGLFELPESHREGDRRVALAEWLTRPDHPLVWRSIVNRVWQYHFGRGIVDSPNDFGHMGRLPSHPELLDWLAVEFRDHQGSLKHLHRLIVTSAVYRQTSAIDPNSAAKDNQNVWLSRMNRRRLEAEAIRDSVLQLAGKLNDAQGGPAFQDFVILKPEHSPHYEYRLYDPENPLTHRRSIYRFLVRSQPQPFMTTLDCADPSMQVDKRSETITALQALSLLNNQLMLSMSRHMADHARETQADVSDQLVVLFRQTFSRRPTAEELADLAEFAQQHGLENVCRVLFNLNEFVFVD